MILVSVPYRGATFLNRKIFNSSRGWKGFRPLSGSYISQWCWLPDTDLRYSVSVPYRGATFLNEAAYIFDQYEVFVSVPYRGATFLNYFRDDTGILHVKVSVPYRGATFLNSISGLFLRNLISRFRPLSGSYISQYHPRNPMSCLGRIGGLRGKSNFIEIQLFWKVKSSHKSSI